MIFSDGATGRRRGMAVGVLAAGVTALAMAGCSSSSSSGSSSPAGSLSGQTLTVYTQAPYGTQLNQYKQYYDYIASQFHKATGSTVQWVYSSSAVSLAQELEQAAASGSGPDVWSIGSSFNGTASSLHDFYTFTPGDWNSVGGQSSYVSKQLTMSGPDNSQDIGIPFESIPFVLAYNKALFQKAGISAAPATWSQFVADAQAIQKSSPGTSGAGFSPADPYGPWKPVWSYMEQMDAAYSLAQEAAGTPVANDVAFAPMPSVPLGMSSRPSGGQPAETIVSGNYYDIAKYYQNVPLALKFIQVSTSPQAQLEQFKIMGWMPVTQAGVTEVEKAYPATVPFIQAEQNSTPTDYSPAWSYIETGVLHVIGQEAQQLATGQPYSASYVLGQLQAENSVVQAHLSSS
jgi:multiple sugar transport system substrate-binding protein